MGFPAIAMLCSPDGEIIQVIHDGFDIESKNILNRSFAFLVDQNSVGKSLNFLSEIKEKGVAWDWDLNISLSGKIKNLNFIGLEKNSILLIFGANTIDEAFRMAASIEHNICIKRNGGF